MNQQENKDIHFRAPYVKRNAGEVLYDSGIGYFLHYEVTFTLTSRPDDLPQGKHKLWKAPFSSGDLRIEDNRSC